MKAPLVEDLHCRFEADSFSSPDQLACRDAHVVEDDIASVGAFLAHLVVGFAQRDARSTTLDDEGADTTGSLDLGVGARHHGVDSGFRSIGDEALGAVQDIHITVTNRSGFE